MTKTTMLALTTALLIGSTSMSFAKERTHVRHQAPVTQSFQSRDVALPQGPSAAEESWMDRASHEWDGGGY